MIDRFDMEAVFYVLPCFFVMFSAQDEPDTIGPEGVEKLCKDLGVEPEDVRNVIFVHHIGQKVLHFVSQTTCSPVVFVTFPDVIYTL